MLCWLLGSEWGNCNYLLNKPNAGSENSRKNIEWCGKQTHCHQLCPRGLFSAADRKAPPTFHCLVLFRISAWYMHFFEVGITNHYLKISIPRGTWHNREAAATSTKNPGEPCCPPSRFTLHLSRNSTGNQHPTQGYQECVSPVVSTEWVITRQEKASSCAKPCPRGHHRRQREDNETPQGPEWAGRTSWRVMWARSLRTAAEDNCRPSVGGNLLGFWV